MAPIKQALAQSESKTRFFERLGLNEDNEYHRRLYAMMKEEAVDGRRRMTEDQGALLPELRGDCRVGPPYSHAHVSETAIHREILRIYQRSRPETRQVYNLGRDTDRAEEENWVIRWMLWHVFRYRDNRNKTRRPTSGSNSGTEDRYSVREKDHALNARPGLGIKPTDSGNCHYTLTLHPHATAASRSATRYWDPVRHG